MKELHLGVREYVEFLLQEGSLDSRGGSPLRAQEGSRIHRMLQKKAEEANFQPEVPLSGKVCCAGCDCFLEGRADGVYTDENGGWVIDEIKTVMLRTELITEEMNICHWAQGMVYAYLFALGKQNCGCGVRLTYYSVIDDGVTRFVRSFSFAELEAYYKSLWEQYSGWLTQQSEHGERLACELKGLAFPFAQWRKGQKALSGAVYRLCCEKSAAKEGVPNGFICQAPTGIGKTASVVFPALKYAAQNADEKIFYFTARNTTRMAAEDLLRALHKDNPLSLRSLVLTAKQKCCLCLNELGQPECIPERCPYALDYYARAREAVREILRTEGHYSAEFLQNCGEKYKLCPYELSRDLADWCDFIICDYNYLFHPTIYLDRYFDKKGSYVFLIDEVHNLPDRVCDMYSAVLKEAAFKEVRRLLGRRKSAMRRACDEMLKEFRLICGKPTEDEAAEDGAAGADAAQISFLPAEFAEETEDREEAAVDAESEAPVFRSGQSSFFRTPPRSLYAACMRFCSASQEWLENNSGHPHFDAVLQLFFGVQDFAHRLREYDADFITEIYSARGGSSITLHCTDPAARIRRKLLLADASVLFSATISPLGYYRRLMGCEGVPAAAVPSPYPAENFGIFCAGYISTRYKDRTASAEQITQALYEMVRAESGHYIAFFPSYEYLKRIYDLFTESHPDAEVLLQEKDSDEAQRARFLERFRREDGHAPLLGFCVLGSVFSEGIDLSGDSLIGCAVIGTGLPQVNALQEMRRQEYEAKGCSGFDYAYRYPGMKKVLQAGGRVIRSAEDKGVLLLLDDRYAQPEYAALLPAHWAQIQYEKNEEELQNALKAFWEK